VIADCRRGVLLPGAAAFVRDAAQVMPIGIAPGAMTREIEQLLRDHQLLDAFAAVVGVEATRRSKPSPDPYLEALHRINLGGRAIEPWQTAAIDDSLWGLVAARTAGMRTVGIATRQRQRELEPSAELIVPGLHALTLDTLDTLVSRRKPPSAHDASHAR
jgi:beta-phosphoglucomutase-like phosphatase (HAD superfamily)